MKILLISLLLLSNYLSVLGEDIVICPGVDMTQFNPYICPTTGKLAGYYIDANCVTHNESCPKEPPAVPIPPPPPANDCPNGCPIPDGGGDWKNYPCTNGEIGGPYCNLTLCKWQRNECDAIPDLPRPGYCPKVDPSKVCIRANTPCKADYECPDAQKCCDDSCGITCLAPVWEPYEKDGECPPVSAPPEIGSCAITCEVDNACDGSLKCCANDCGGTACTEPVGEKHECEQSDCLANSISLPQTQVCPDGTLAIVSCVNVSGTCQFLVRKCDDIPDIVRPGFCPIFIDDVDNPTSNCSLTCTRDNDCAPDKKCCFSSSTCKAPACTNIVKNECVVAGYRGLRCLKKYVATALYPNGNPTTPDDNIALNDECYRCAALSVCGWRDDKQDCSWDGFMDECLAKCLHPPNITVPVPCEARGVCNCLGSSDCVWCQASYTVTDKDTNSDRKVPYGVCLRKEACNKCTATTDSAGFSGSVVYSKPHDCDSVDLPIGTKDPSDLIPDNLDKIKQIIKSCTNGSFTENSYQNVLKALGISDVIINLILQPSTDGKIGTIQITITILSDRSIADVIKDLNKAIAKRFNIKESQITTYLESISSSTTKRSIWATTSGSYLQSSSIQEDTATPSSTPSASPSSGFIVTPIWLLLSLIAFFLWRQ